MEGDIAATYTLIHRFLKQQSQNKVAEAVKKAAKNIVDLGNEVEYQGPPLEDIIKEWRTRQHPVPKHLNPDPSSKESESSDVSSSDSEESSDSDSNVEDTSSSESGHDDTSDGDDQSDEEMGDVRPPQKRVERDTSETLSSAGENARALATQVIEKQPTKKRGSTTDSDSSDSDSSDSDDSDSDGDGSAQENPASDISDAKKSPDSDSSSDSDSSEENESEETEKVLPDTTKTTENEESSSSESDSDSESTQKGDVQTAKKRKTSENGPAVTTAVASRLHQTTRSLHNEKSSTNAVERFQRVKFQNLAPELLLDNGFEARGGKTSDYGQRAHRDLIVTRGAGFRKEKNKKKRGSYRGGEITMENHSIRFDF